MTKKLLVTIALGGALAIIAAGSATSSLTTTSADVQVEVPSTTTTSGATTTSGGGGSVLPPCSNLSDDDGDGLVDLSDPGCSSPLDDSEYNAPTSAAARPPAARRRVAPAAPAPRRPPPPRRAGATKKPGKTTIRGGKSLFGKLSKKGKGAKQIAKVERQKIQEPNLRNPDGSPASANPGLTVATFGPAPIGVPNFVIDSFEIPPFLLPIYQSCGTEYGIPWQVLAGINKIETAFGTNLNVSSAGAEGWMQFIPSTWAAYGLDANSDGRKDPYNPVDAICAAARYLRAAGADHGPSPGDLRLQPRRLVRRRGSALCQPVRQASRRPGRLAHRAHRGRPLPGRRRRALRR